MDDDFTPIQSENKRKNYGIADYISSTVFSVNFLLFNLFNLEQRIEQNKKKQRQLDDYLLWIFLKLRSQLPFFMTFWGDCMYFATLKPLCIMGRSVSIV